MATLIGNLQRLPPPKNIYNYALHINIKQIQLIKLLSIVLLILFKFEFQPDHTHGQ